jgi:transcriptional regulator with XRE-family HTH domain
MSDFSAALARLMTARGLGVRELARMVPCNPGHISNLRSGKGRPSAELAEILDEQLEAGAGTVERLELAVDELATAYPGTPPGELLGRVRAYLGYVGTLLDGRITLAEHRRLLIAGGWLSLLAATTLIDLHRDHAAAAHLRTAARLARETGHAEIAAWCLETQAWQVLTEGDYRRAVEISQAAKQIAPKSGSAFIQATAQEGRAWARLGDASQTRAALGRVEALVAQLPVPDRPEHHYRYDPAKSEAYTATTLAWLGDPAAESYARHILARLESATDGPPRPRRAASARLDLSLALIASGRHDEAAGTALEAINSGRIVPSNYWRAREVIRLMPLAAQHPRAALAGVGGQQLPQHAAAGLQQPGAQRSLGGPEPAVAAQRPGRFGGQPCYLGGPGFRERGEEPPFSPSGTGGACVRAAGRASQIRSFTSAICSTAAVNSAYRAISRRTFSTSAAAS